MEAPPTEPELLCGACGYNLRGVPSNRCPECGREFDPNYLIANLIPWEQRRYVGRFRAFWHTAWIASFQPRRLAAYMDRPINAGSARLFHLWVILFAALGVASIPWTILNIWPRLFNNPRRGEPDELNAFIF